MIMMMSRYPFNFLGKIKYNDCKDFPDSVARKGPLLVEMNDGQQTFQLFGTHMQAGGGKELKKKQIEQAAAFMPQHRKPVIPQSSAGDWNVRNSDTVLHPKLLQGFEAETGGFSGVQHHTSDHGKNDMKARNAPRKHARLNLFSLKATVLNQNLFHAK